MDIKKCKYELIVMAIAIISGIAFIILRPGPVFMDSHSLSVNAIEIAEGRGFASTSLHRKQVANPLYPVFLALIYKVFGVNYNMVRIIQVIIFSFTCLIIFKIAELIFNEKVGFYSAFLVALHPVMIATTSHLLNECFYTFLLALGVLLLTLSFTKSNKWLYFLTGVVLGLGLLQRSVGLLFPFFIFIGLILRYKNKLNIVKYFLILCLGLIIVISPWMIHIYRLFGAIQPLNNMGGRVFWFGTFTQGDSDSEIAQETFQKVLKKIDAEIDQDKDPVKWDRRFYFEGLKNIKNHPFRYVLLFPPKIFRLWVGTHSTFFVTGHIKFGAFLRNKGLLKEHPFVFMCKAFILTLTFITFLLAILGVFYNRHNWPRTLPLLLILSYTTIFHMLVLSINRYSIPAIPYAIIFAVSWLKRDDY